MVTGPHSQYWYYDARQRLCRQAVPETGHTLYGYDAANQLIHIARGQGAGTACTTPPSASRVTQVWDNRGRLDQVQYPDASPDINFGYDANGNMTSAVRGTTNWTYQYNALNALTSESLVVDGLSFVTGYTRNANNFATHQTTPGGRTVSYVPDGFGRATRVQVGSSSYASAASYHPSGGLSALSYGNGRTLSQSYNARQLMTGLTVSGGVLNFAYAHDANARITTITDTAVAGQNRSFGYDGLGRVATASGPWGSGTILYDPLGNIRRQTLGSRVVDINYNSLNRVSQVRDTATGSVWRNYTHDARGSVTSNGQLNWVYDRSEQPVSMSGSDSGSFVYDAHRRRVRQDINGETIYSVYTSGGSMVFRRNTTTGETTDYLRLGSRTVARLNQASAVTYTHADHLGSPAAATNAAGSVLWREDYTPFGEARQQPTANADGESFTGHITDSDTGVVYMQARYYDPAIGRFLSNDPVGFASGGVGYFNRYAYVGNDPLNATDPTGEQAVGVNAEVTAVLKGGGRIAAEGAIDLSSGEVRARLTVGPRVGVRGRANASVFMEPSSTQGNQLTTSAAGVAEASLGIKSPIGSAEASLNLSAGGEDTNGSTEFFARADPSAGANWGPVSVDDDGRASVSLGASAGAAAGLDYTIDVNISIPDTLDAIQGVIDSFVEKDEEPN